MKNFLKVLKVLIIIELLFDDKNLSHFYYLYAFLEIYFPNSNSYHFCKSSIFSKSLPPIKVVAARQCPRSARVSLALPRQAIQPNRGERARLSRRTRFTLKILYQEPRFLIIFWKRERNMNEKSNEQENSKAFGLKILPFNRD